MSALRLFRMVQTEHVQLHPDSTTESLPCTQTTDLVEPNVNSIDITVTPNITYKFQAVAREDKGVLGGIDWNKSPVVEFKTSSSNREGDNISFIAPVKEITNCHCL